MSPTAIFDIAEGADMTMGQRIRCAPSKSELKVFGAVLFGSLKTYSKVLPRHRGFVRAGGGLTT